MEDEARRGKSEILSTAFAKIRVWTISESNYKKVYGGLSLQQLDGAYELNLPYSATGAGDPRLSLRGTGKQLIERLSRTQRA